MCTLFYVDYSYNIIVEDCCRRLFVRGAQYNLHKFADAHVLRRCMYMYLIHVNTSTRRLAL